MFKRAVRLAVRAGHLDPTELAGATDGSLMEQLLRTDPTGLAAAVHGRRLYKRALDLPASDVPGEAEPWVTGDVDLLERVEDALATELELEPSALLLDFPARESMLAVDLPLRTRTGQVERLTDEGRAGQLGLPRIASELYRSARRLRVFTARPLGRSVSGVIRLVTSPANQVTERLDAGRPLLG